MAKEELTRLNSKDKGARRKVLFLITDGSQSLGKGIVNQAVVSKEIRSLGVRIIVIGIGSNIKAKELEAIAGGPANVHLASQFTQLLSEKSLQKLSNVGCRAGLRDFIHS